MIWDKVKNSSCNLDCIFVEGLVVSEVILLYEIEIVCILSKKFNNISDVINISFEPRKIVAG